MNREQRRAAVRSAKKDKGIINTCWNDLNLIYSQCSELMSRHSYISQLSQNQALWPFLTDAAAVTSNLNILTRDLNDLTGRLSAINGKHYGKTGGSEDPNVIMNCIQIYEEYTEFMNTHESVVMPTIAALLDAFSVAEIAYQQTLNKVAEIAVDPSTVSVSIQGISEQPVPNAMTAVETSLNEGEQNA